MKWLYEPDLTSEEIEQALHRAGFEEDEHEDDYEEEDEEEGEWLAFRPPLHLAPQPDEIVDLVARPLETYVEFVPLTEVAEDWPPDALWRRGILNADPSDYSLDFELAEDVLGETRNFVVRVDEGRRGGLRPQGWLSPACRSAPPRSAQ